MQTLISQPPTMGEKIHRFITCYWLVVGYVALLSGLFWAPDGSVYNKQFYALMAIPALLALAISPRFVKVLLGEPIILGYLAFTAWLLASLAWSQTDSSLASLAKRPLYVFMLFAACALVALDSPQRLLAALRLGAFSAVLAALISLAVHLSLGAAEPRLIGTGALRNPLLTSHVLGFFCTYWIAAWLCRSERHDWLPLLCALPLLAALIATGSRTPLMALGITSLWMLLMTPRRSLYLLVALGLVMLALTTLSPDQLLERGASFRPQLWTDAARQASEHLWLGRGYEADFTFLIAEIGYPLSDPHNVELAVLLQLGIPGLLLWLFMYGATYWRCWQLGKERSMQIASALITYGLAAGLTEGSNFLSRPNENWFLIWIPLALAAALSIQLRQDKR